MNNINLSNIIIYGNPNVKWRSNITGPADSLTHPVLSYLLVKDCWCKVCLSSFGIILVCLLFMIKRKFHYCHSFWYNGPTLIPPCMSCKEVFSTHNHWIKRRKTLRRSNRKKNIVDRYEPQFWHYRHIPKEIEEECLQRADGKCEYCFKNLLLRNGKYRYVRDHVKPFKFFKDPLDNPHYRDNIRIIHHHCHDIKTSEIDKLLKSNNDTYECLDIVINYFLDNVL